MELTNKSRNARFDLRLVASATEPWPLANEELLCLIAEICANHDCRPTSQHKNVLIHWEVTQRNEKQQLVKYNSSSLPVVWKVTVCHLKSRPSFSSQTVDWFPHSLGESANHSNDNQWQFNSSTTNAKLLINSTTTEWAYVAVSLSVVWRPDNSNHYKQILMIFC